MITTPSAGLQAVGMGLDHEKARTGTRNRSRTTDANETRGLSDLDTHLRS